MNIYPIPNEYPTDGRLARALHCQAVPAHLRTVRVLERHSRPRTVVGEVVLAVPALAAGAEITVPWAARWPADGEEPLIEPSGGQRGWRVESSNVQLTSDAIAWVDLRLDLWLGRAEAMCAG